MNPFTELVSWGSILVVLGGLVLWCVVDHPLFVLLACIVFMITKESKKVEY